MVLFALTAHGLDEMFEIARGRVAAIWVNQGLLAASDMKRLRAEGFDLTNFTHWVDPTDESLVQEAVETIREHHPGHALYVERA